MNEVIQWTAIVIGYILLLVRWGSMSSTEHKIKNYERVKGTILDDYKLKFEKAKPVMPKASRHIKRRPVSRPAKVKKLVRKT